jgi:hypothetical protein
MVSRLKKQTGMEFTAVSGEKNVLYFLIQLCVGSIALGEAIDSHG